MTAPAESRGYGIVLPNQKGNEHEETDNAWSGRRRREYGAMVSSIRLKKTILAIVALVLALLALYWVRHALHRPFNRLAFEKLHESDEIETEIVRMVGQLSETTFDAKSLCDKIAQVPDEETRGQYLKTLMDRAYSVRFEDFGDVHAPDWEVRQEVHRRLGYAYSGLQNLSLAIWTHFWAQGASQKEQFTPLFRYAEKMKIEAERLGKEGKGLSLGLDVIERIYGINQKSGNGSPDDFAWIEENFRRISGRQIRTESQVDADNRAESTRKGTIPSR